MRVAFFGSGEFGLPTFDSIRHDGHEIVLVISQPDKARGRGKDLSPTIIKSAAIEAKIAVITPVNVNSPDIIAQIKNAKADLAYIAAFGQKIGPELLTAFPVGIVNLHASLLPELRGAAPIQWAVINGHHLTGVTVFRLVEKMDAGPILMQRSTAIGEDETADELHDRLARVGCDAVRATIKLLEQEPHHPGTPQDESKVTLAAKLSKHDGRITFDQPVVKLAHRICGLWSWPGASCRFTSADGKRDEVVIVARARRHQATTAPATSKDQIGRVTDMLGVQVADDILDILQIKPANGSLMDWKDFVNGRHVKPGDRFLPIESAS